MGLLTALPMETRFRVVEVQIEPDRLGLEGQARSHGEAEGIAASLRTLPDWQVNPPSTHSLRERGVAFSVTATRTSSSAPTP